MLKAFTWIHWILLLFTLGQSIVLVVDATTLTYMVKAGEKACFHAWVDEVGQKVAFYFAVLSLLSFISCESIMKQIYALLWKTPQKMKCNSIHDCRCKRAVTLISTMWFWTLRKRLSWTPRMNAKAISYSVAPWSVNTVSVSAVNNQVMRTNWWISRLSYRDPKRPLKHNFPSIEKTWDNIWTHWRNPCSRLELIYRTLLEVTSISARENIETWKRCSRRNRVYFGWVSWKVYWLWVLPVYRQVICAYCILLVRIFMDIHRSMWFATSFPPRPSPVSETTDIVYKRETWETQRTLCNPWCLK